LYQKREVNEVEELKTEKLENSIVEKDEKEAIEYINSQ